MCTFWYYEAGLAVLLALNSLLFCGKLINAGLLSSSTLVTLCPSNTILTLELESLRFSMIRSLLSLENYTLPLIYVRFLVDLSSNFVTMVLLLSYLFMLSCLLLFLFTFYMELWITYCLKWVLLIYAPFKAFPS